MTYQECAESYIEQQTRKWRGPNTRSNVEGRQMIYAYPVFGELPVQGSDPSRC
jgi:hypothetical protein